MTRIPLVLATRNEGKTEEIKALLANFPIDIKNLADFGPSPPIDEDGETFEENAVKKARSTAKILGLPALADDSGLMVEALGGLPGVRSARYAGEDATDSDNNAKLLQELENVKNRKAAFACVIAIAVPWGPALIYEGQCEGLINREGVGSQGWGRVVALDVFVGCLHLPAGLRVHQHGDQLVGLLAVGDVVGIGHLGPEGLTI